MPADAQIKTRFIISENNFKPSDEANPDLFGIGRENKPVKGFDSRFGGTETCRLWRVPIYPMAMERWYSGQARPPLTMARQGKAFPARWRWYACSKVHRLGAGSSVLWAFRGYGGP